MLTPEQLKDFARFSYLLTGRANPRSAPLFGLSEFGIWYLATRLHRGHAVEMRISWCDRVLAAGGRGDVDLAQIALPLIERMIELCLDYWEVRRADRDDARDFLYTLIYGLAPDIEEYRARE